MDEIKEIAYQATVNYFNILPKVGYINDADTNKYLLLLFLNDFLDEFLGYINEEDFNIIYKLLNCIGQTDCFIPQFNCKYTAKVVGNQLQKTPFRIAEWTDLRDTQHYDLRLINQL